MCLNENSASPRTWLDGSRLMRSLDSSAPNASSTPSRSSNERSTPGQKCLPTTDAARTVARGSAGSASIREAIAARTVVGSSSDGPRSTTRRCELLDEQRVPLRDLHQPLDRRQVSSVPTGGSWRSTPSRRVTAPPAGSSYVRGRRFPSRAAPRAAPSARARGTPRAHRGRERPGTRGDRAGRGRPSGCLRRRTPWAARARPVRRTGEPRSTAGRVPRPPRRRTQSDHRAEEPRRLLRFLRPHQLADPAPPASSTASDAASVSKIPATWRTCSANAR